MAVGALVDAAIVVVEQTHKKLEKWEEAGRPGDYRRVIIDAVKEVGGPSFFSLLVIAVAFVPIFALQAQEGRLFKPLAFTKNSAMAVAAVLAITLDPALRLLFPRLQPFRFRPRWLSSAVTRVVVGTIEPEEKTWISRVLMAVYHPALLFVLRHRYTTILVVLLVMVLTVPVFLGLGEEFMPPLNEGTILYMPITLPGISVTEATKYLQIQDKLLKEFPEVESVFGKVGKAETSTDPAPLSMVETTVVLKPEKEWRSRKMERWYSGWVPQTFKSPLRWLWPDERRITWEELIDEMDRAVHLVDQLLPCNPPLVRPEPSQRRFECLRDPPGVPPFHLSGPPFLLWLQNDRRLDHAEGRRIGRGLRLAHLPEDALHLGELLEQLVLDLEVFGGFRHRDPGESDRHVQDRPFVEGWHELLAEAQEDRDREDHHEENDEDGRVPMPQD